MSAPPPKADPRPVSARPAVWFATVLALGVVLLALVLWLTSRPSNDGGAQKTPLPANSPPSEPVVPPELAALGADPDGGGVATAEELRAGTDPLVADVPDVRFVFEDVECGLRVDATTLEFAQRFRVASQERIDSWGAVQTAGVQTERTAVASATFYSGGTGLSAGPFAVPLSYVGRHDRSEVTSTNRSYAAFAVKSEQLDVVKTSITSRQKDQAARQIEAHAGYISGSG